MQGPLAGMNIILFCASGDFRATDFGQDKKGMASGSCLNEGERKKPDFPNTIPNHTKHKPSTKHNIPLPIYSITYCSLSFMSLLSFGRRWPKIHDKNKKNKNQISLCYLNFNQVKLSDFLLFFFFRFLSEQSGPLSGPTTTKPPAAPYVSAHRGIGRAQDAARHLDYGVRNALTRPRIRVELIHIFCSKEWNTLNKLWPF